MKDIVKVLNNYKIEGEIVKIEEGPLVRRIEFKPKAGTKIKNITDVLSDIAREMSVSSIQLETLDNSNNIGFNITQEKMQIIDFNKIISSSSFLNATGDLPICLGVDVVGAPVFEDLAKIPHLLVAGTTGSGKSVGLNTFLISLIGKRAPNELKFVLIDPKRIEFSLYNNNAYMLFPVVTDNNEAVQVLKYLVDEMNNRYVLLEKSQTKNIYEYNRNEIKMPYIVCVVDEFSDIVLTSKDASKYIQLLAQKARAAGIHIILATQRPSVDVVTGSLKANFPCRLSYRVATSVDSRTILDATGAENLFGRGDALFLSAGGKLKRVHGAYIDDNSIKSILAPFKSRVNIFEPKIENKPTKTKKIKEKNNINEAISLWSSLKKKDKKTIISSASWLARKIFGIK